MTPNRVSLLTTDPLIISVAEEALRNPIPPLKNPEARRERTSSRGRGWTEDTAEDLEE